MLLDVLHLLVPTTAVHAEYFQAARRRNAVETGFDEAKQGTPAGIFQLEHHQGGGFLRIVNRGIHCIRMPAEGKHALRFDTLDQYIPQEVFVSRIGDVPLCMLASDEVGGVTGITADDWFVTDDIDDTTPLLFAVARRPRRVEPAQTVGANAFTRVST